MSAEGFEKLCVVATRVTALASLASAETHEAATASGDRADSPYVDRDYPTRPFFGEPHVHTGLSMDAGAFGARLSPTGADLLANPTGKKWYDTP